MRLLPCGDRALLVDVASARDAADPASRGILDRVLVLAGELRRTAPAGVVDVVPAARTVLVQVEPSMLALAEARVWVERSVAAVEDRVSRGGATRDRRGGADAEDLVLDVVYDGPDLPAVAEHLGMSVEALVRRHRDAVWTVAFTGFAPGFGYLVSPDWPFDVPRRAAPRTRVPAGAVGLAGTFCGAYPRETPGGWQLIGTTDARLFDPDAAAPVLLSPGRRVRFAPSSRPALAGLAPATALPPAELHPRPAELHHDPAELHHDPAELHHDPAELHHDPAELHHDPAEMHQDPAQAPHDPAVEVTAVGLSATLQDAGRAGRAADGIARAGALDQEALQAVNRLVGNPPEAAGVEVVLGGLAARARRDLWVAVAGAPAPLTVAGRAAPRAEAVLWPAGTELRLGMPPAGVRTMVAVRGGVTVPPVAGSRSTDTLSGLGPAPLGVGALLSVGPDPAAPIPVAVPTAAAGPAGIPPTAAEDAASPGRVWTVEFGPGPRRDWFAASALDVLVGAVWTVTDRADRVGVRLDGPPLARVRDAELASEGMVPGAVQVPPDGRPVVLLADGPVTGGYPVVAVVAAGSLRVFAQCRPGDGIRFRHARPI